MDDAARNAEGAGLEDIYNADRTGGSFEDTTSFDGITIKPTAGTWTGQINIYGWLD